MNLRLSWNAGFQAEENVKNFFLRFLIYMRNFPTSGNEKAKRLKTEKINVKIPGYIFYYGS